ncbi:FAD-binding monooxygenase [Kineosporia mesophila]|uniref:FAD-binding monooxygenase n=2 Tax=Kineosporia mesophila TaxID=566012 RepID=A0ABP7A0H9_9ACTN
MTVLAYFVTMTSAAQTFAEIGATEPPASPTVSLGAAVVLGGSIAGMLAARVLADHAETVLIVDRDDLATADGHRNGVPQGNQAHVLLAAGGRHLERWFPGFTDRAVAAGALPLISDQVAIYDDFIPRVSGSQLNRLALTRPFLEQLIRAELQGVPNVKFVAERVTGLEFGDTAVTGVRYESGVEPADLVVDALGRGSRVGDWLEEGGWEKPALVRVPNGLNYATAFFRRPPGDQPIGMGMALVGSPVTGGAIFMMAEDDRWMVIQAGYGDFKPGHTNEDMIARCRRDYPEPFGHVVDNEMLGDVATYRQSDSRRRDYGGCERLPARLISVGDAVASFNPIFAQGISSAALQASALAGYLQSNPDLNTPARDFLARQKVVVDAAWSIATSGAGAGQARPSPTQRVRGWLIGRVVAANLTDASVNRVFVEVTQMLRHPSDLASPAVVRRALLASRNRRPAPVPPLDR